MSYTPHTLTASGTTITDLRTGGWLGVLKRIQAANPEALAFSGSPAGADAIQALTQGVGGRIALIAHHAPVAVDRYLHGDPVPIDSVTADLQVVADAFRALALACDEAAALIDANPGTIQQVQVAGQHRPRRVFS